MGTQTRPADGALTLIEMKEFASFSAATQRYIRRSLDVAYGRSDPIETWARDVRAHHDSRMHARRVQPSEKNIK